MPEPLGLIVVLKNGDHTSLAGLRIHDETTIGEAVDRARALIAREPELFDAATEVVIGEVSIREVQS